jgi:hypothetical protein
MSLPKRLGSALVSEGFEGILTAWPKILEEFLGDAIAGVHTSGLGSVDLLNKISNCRGQTHWCRRLE